MKGYKEPKHREVAVPTDAEWPRVTPAFLAVDQITRTGERCGWPSRDAFFAAMVMHAHGVTPSEAERLFKRAEEWRQ